MKIITAALLDMLLTILPHLTTSTMCPMYLTLSQRYLSFITDCCGLTKTHLLWQITVSDRQSLHREKLSDPSPCMQDLEQRFQCNTRTNMKHTVLSVLVYRMSIYCRISQPFLVAETILWSKKCHDWSNCRNGRLSNEFELVIFCILFYKTWGKLDRDYVEMMIYTQFKHPYPIYMKLFKAKINSSLWISWESIKQIHVGTKPEGWEAEEKCKCW